MSGLFTYRNFSLKDTPPLSGKVAVVTVGIHSHTRNSYSQYNREGKAELEKASYIFPGQSHPLSIILGWNRNHRPAASA